MNKEVFSKLSIRDKIYDYNEERNAVDEFTIESKKIFVGGRYYSLIVVDNIGARLRVDFADSMFFGLNELSAIDAFVDINQRLIQSSKLFHDDDIDIEKLEKFVANALELKRQLLANRTFDDLRDCNGNVIREGDRLRVAKNNADDYLGNPVERSSLFICKVIGIESRTNKNMAILVDVETHYGYSAYAEEIVGFEKEWKN